MVSWRGGVVYKPRPNGSVYAGAGTSFNPSAEGLALSASTVNLEPEKTRNYEVGTKWDLPRRRLSMNAAIFSHGEDQRAHARHRIPAIRRPCWTGSSGCRASSWASAGRLTSRCGARSAATPSCAATSLRRTRRRSSTTTWTLTPRHTFNLWSTFRLPWETTRRRRRAVHGRRVPQHAEHHRGPELLASSTRWPRTTSTGI